VLTPWKASLGLTKLLPVTDWELVVD
jgi:hypothetical protein